MGVENEQADAGRDGWTRLETKISGADGDREMLIFPVQVTTSRIGNLTRLILTLAICVTIHTYCRESAGTEPINLKVVPVTGAALAGHHEPINMPIFFHTHFWYEVSMLKVSATVCMVSTFQQSMDEPGMVTKMARGQLNRKNAQ